MCTGTSGGLRRRTSGWIAVERAYTVSACVSSSSRWDLSVRGTEMDVPERLFTAPLPVVAAYLRSIFQAEGFVSARAMSTVVEVDMISEPLVRGIQRLLLRFGIYARVEYQEGSAA